MKIVVAAVLLQSLPITTAAQNQTLNFDVVSIKPDVVVAPRGQPEFFACHGTDGSSIDSMGISLPRNSAVLVPMASCVGARTSLGMLLNAAYGVRRTEKKPGAPGWIERDQFAIEAKAVGPATAVQLKEMVRSLLRDRFKLEFHRETRQVDGFVLSVAKNVSKLKTATGREEYTGIHYGPPPEPGQNIVNAVNVPFSDFFKNISDVLLPNLLGKPVIDETHIDGNYDITLGPFLERQDPRFSCRTIFEAFQDLGLRLEPQKVAVELFIIDHAEKPDPN